MVHSDVVFRYMTVLNIHLASIRSALLIDKALLHIKKGCTGRRKICVFAFFHGLVFVQELLYVNLFIWLNTLQFLSSGPRCGFMGLSLRG